MVGTTLRARERFVPYFSIGLTLLSIVICASSTTAQQPAKPTGIVVDEGKDGLPGTCEAPTRSEIEEMIRLVGRDPVTPELIDRIETTFRPRWAVFNRFKIEKRCSQLKDPKFLAMVDELSTELWKKPADTFVLIRCTQSYYDTMDAAQVREFVKGSMKSLMDPSAPTRKVHGRVTDEDSSRPIVGAVVWVQDQLTRTDADGKYSLKYRKPAEGVAAIALTVEAAGFALAQTALDWDENNEAKVKDVVLPRSVQYTGRVIDIEGKPIPDAGVVLYTRGETVDRDGSMRQRGLGNNYQFTCRTDKNGIYALRNIPPDTSATQVAYQLSVSHPKHQSRGKSYTPNEELGPGWEITMEKGATVKGVVLNEQGKPIPNALVFTRAPIYATTNSDANGHFRIDTLAAGPTQVLVQAPGYVYQMTPADAVLGDPDDIKVTLDDGVYFEGKLVDAEDKPVSGATIGYLQPIDQNGVVVPDPDQQSMGSPSAVSKADGSFKVGPVKPGRYWIRAISRTSDGRALQGSRRVSTDVKDLIIKIGANDEK